MRRSLIASENTVLQNAWGFFVAATLVPTALVLKLVTWPFERPMKRTAEEVVDYLEDFINGTGSDWDWDDFVSIPIADPALDTIRERASRFPEPEVGLSELKALLQEAKALASG